MKTLDGFRELYINSKQREASSCLRALVKSGCLVIEPFFKGFDGNKPAIARLECGKIRAVYNLLHCGTGYIDGFCRLGQGIG